jgi:pimeloyl-ACP methyl ester carboxylesterase
VSRTKAPYSVYAETLRPDVETGRPTVVMIHGGAHSGECYLQTPDGRPGWAYRFASRGYPVVVPDWPGIGRSGAIPLDQLNGSCVVEVLRTLLKSLKGSLVLLTHSMSGCYGWRLAELEAKSIAAVLSVAPAPPGNIQPVPKIIAETDQTIEIETFGRPMVLEKIGLNFPARDFIAEKYIGGSQFFPRDYIDTYAASILGIPPLIRMERRNIRGSQVRLDEPKKLADKPIFVMLGSEDIDHPRETDEAIVTWLDEQGAAAEFCYLPDRGIAGNGHMMMLETNSDALADIMIDWLDATIA